MELVRSTTVVNPLMMGFARIVSRTVLTEDAGKATKDLAVVHVEAVAGGEVEAIEAIANLAVYPSRALSERFGSPADVFSANT